MLTKTLKRFRARAKGPQAFTLPNGDEIDVRVKQSRHALAKWILGQFGGDMDAADDAVSDIASRALNVAGAPWPYLIQAIANRAAEQKEQPAAPPDQVHCRFKQSLGLSRWELLSQISMAGASTEVAWNSHRHSLTVKSANAKFLQHLLGRDPYVAFYLLSPQYIHRYRQMTGYQLLLDDISNARFEIEEMEHEKLLRAKLLNLICDGIKACRFENDFADALATSARFYVAFEHPIQCLWRWRRTKEFVCIDEAYERILLWLSRAGSKDDLTVIPGAWLPVALRRGIIVNPLEWVVQVIETGVDPTEDYRDYDWYSPQALEEAYGFGHIVELFPNLKANNG